MRIRDHLHIDRLWPRSPVVAVLRFEGVIISRPRRDGVSLASHAAAIERAFRASHLVAVGVVSAGFGFAQLIERLGVERRLYTAGERKSLLDPFLPQNPADVERLAVLQQDIHRAFKEHVQRRRAGKIDTGDESLFNGDVLTGRMALNRGLVDGIGELRGVLRARYGDKVKLRPFAAERRRWPFWRRLPFTAREPIASIADLADWVEARLLWASFGL